MEGNRKKKLFCIIFFVIGLFVGGFAAFGYLKYKEGDKGDKKEEKEASTDDLEEIVIEDYNANECVKLGKYKGLTISLAPTEDDLQYEIDSLIEEHTEYEQKKGMAQEGDMVFAEFEGYIEGKKRDTTCGEDYVEIGSGLWVNGFEDAIIGMQCGQEKEFSVQIPDGYYGDEEIDGHTVDFKLTLKYICGESIVPEYNDEFVRSISNYKTTKEYDAYLKKKLLDESEDEKLEYVWSEVMEASKVEKYPKTLLAASRKEVLQGYYNLADMQGMSHDEIFQSWGCEDEKDFVKTQLPDLEKDTAKEMLVAKAIAENEKLSYTTEDYEDLLKEEYENNSDVYDSKEAYEKENKNYLEKTALMNVVKEWLGEQTNYTKK